MLRRDRSLHTNRENHGRRRAAVGCVRTLFSPLGVLLVASSAAAAPPPSRVAERASVCARPADDSPAEDASRVLAPPPHPGISFHGLYPHDRYDSHDYDVERHQVDKLAGTSRQSRAHRVFGVAFEAPAQPRTATDRGISLVDTALAAADRGELAEGARVMRRAFRDAAVRGVCRPIGRDLRDRLLDLVEDYGAAAARGEGVKQQDAEFMRAALYYLLGEHGVAERWIERAIAAGDASPSAERLRSQVRRRLYEAL